LREKGDYFRQQIEEPELWEALRCVNELRCPDAGPAEERRLPAQGHCLRELERSVMRYEG
jgi:hypothetical protein